MPELTSRCEVTFGSTPRGWAENCCSRSSSTGARRWTRHSTGHNNAPMHARRGGHPRPEPGRVVSETLRAASNEVAVLAPDWCVRLPARVV